MLLILLDDVGFGSLATFGGPVSMPAFQGIADRGVLYNQFHTTALCSPTRAAMLTGRQHHAVHMGGITEIANSFPFEEQIDNSLVVREGVGVVACITPWNYPLHQVTAKLAPALVAGCTVVLKPSEVAPLTAYILAEVIADIDLPAGVFNMVTGTGPVVGEALVTNPDVAMVSFTGSTRAGKRIMELCAQQVKKVALELGGKSPFVILDDAPAEDAVRAGFQSTFQNNGQTCIAWTRFLVPESRKEEFVTAAREVAESYTAMDPAQATDFSAVGPLASKAQQDRVRGYINKGIEEGATLVTGGAEQPEGLEKGFFIQPTVFADVTNDMTIAQEEIFGPVLAILRAKDYDDALRIANDTEFGLTGAVFSKNPAKIQRAREEFFVGNLYLNRKCTGAMVGCHPFGGFNMSGTDSKAGGQDYLLLFLQAKSIAEKI